MREQSNVLYQLDQFFAWNRLTSGVSWFKCWKLTFVMGSSKLVALLISLSSLNSFLCVIPDFAVKLTVFPRKHLNVVSSLSLSWYQVATSHNVKSTLKHRCVRQRWNLHRWTTSNQCLFKSFEFKFKFFKLNTMNSKFSSLYSTF